MDESKVQAIWKLWEKHQYRKEYLEFAVYEHKVQVIRKLWEKHQNRKEEESK